MTDIIDLRETLKTEIKTTKTENVRLHERISMNVKKIDELQRAVEALEGV